MLRPNHKPHAVPKIAVGTLDMVRNNKTVTKLTFAGTPAWEERAIIVASLDTNPIGIMEIIPVKELTDMIIQPLIKSTEQLSVQVIIRNCAMFVAYRKNLEKHIAD